MKTHSTALVWFRRDLRLADNPALLHAIASAKHVVPVFIFSPDAEGDWPPGEASNWWLHHSLVALGQSLQKRGAALIVRKGPARRVLQDLVAETGATLVAWNRLYEPALIERDTQIKKSLTDAGIAAESRNAALLFEPWAVRNGKQEPYRVFTPFWRSLLARTNEIAPPQAAPRRITVPGELPSSMSTADLKLLPEVRWDAGLAGRWTPGEAGAHEALKKFQSRAARYDTQRDRPDVSGTSSLSPHLHFGEIGPRQVFAQLHLHAASDASLATFARELGWREFAHHLLFHFPNTTDAPLDARFEHWSWRRSRSLLRSWQRGVTGFPIVDAGMRELWHTGWMHNRVRMIVASFLTKNLQIHWLQGAKWFWDTLVDADLANNTLGWQWTAGCGADAAPYYRIFNPVLQAEKFDPQRSYIRRWIPELAALPDKWIHKPWEAPDDVLASANVVFGKSYPRPVVNLQGSREEALAAYETMKRAADSG